MQVASLKKLRNLSLGLAAAQPTTVADSIDVVTRLAALTSLVVHGNFAAMPGSLSALGGQLKELALSTVRRAVFDAGGIAAFSNLTQLQLRASHGVAPAAGLQHLNRLQTLFICNGHLAAEAPEPALAAPPGQPMLRMLPAGVLANLTHLSVSYDVLFGSLDVLPAAARLQHVDVLRLQCMPTARPPGEQPLRWDALSNWLCTHPPLRRFSLVCWTSVRAEVLDLLLALAQRRPSLLIERKRKWPA